MDYTVTGLLADIRRRGSIPDAAVTGTQDADLLVHMNDVLQLKLASMIITVREGYFRQVLDTPISSTNTRYRLPGRALGNKIAACLLIDAQGNVLRKLNELSYGRLREYYAVNDAAGYVFEAGSIVLKPGVPSSTATILRFMYYVRPNQVTNSLDTTTADSFTITGIAGNVLTITSGHNITTTTAIDLVKQDGAFEHVAIGVFPSATATATVTVPDASQLAVGDYVCKAQKAPVAQVPGEYYPLLAHLTAMEVLMSTGDLDNHKRLAEMLPQLEKDAAAMIAPRNEEGSKKIMSSYGSLGALDGPYRRSFWGI